MVFSAMIIFVLNNDQGELEGWGSLTPWQSVRDGVVESHVLSGQFVMHILTFFLTRISNFFIARFKLLWSQLQGSRWDQCGVLALFIVLGHTVLPVRFSPIFGRFHLPPVDCITTFDVDDVLVSVSQRQDTESQVQK